MCCYSPLHPLDALTNDLLPENPAGRQCLLASRAALDAGWLLPQCRNHQAEGCPLGKAFSQRELLFASHPEQIGANVLLSCASDRSLSAPRTPSPQATSLQCLCQHRHPSSQREALVVAEPSAPLPRDSSLEGNKSTARLLPWPGCP